ncbi:response regulator receiver protein [Denitrovibrio acetiphilus DSM 12809]|uniref:Response regulator receiver protein n=1 Tax=Denitrovibrio acetiphilus (strain DSM 12809 / NBRC 114555 / N2460) TaxID=522772 RepID=D4H209_DENA2|nr:response regulator [Denitrovibrio acetiphilus]ADD66986.1 response regulator receiver protein [Denitrovibrio acetiphilus DSM 12809]
METKNILLIDDEDQFRNGVKIALKKQGYKVIEAADGYEGMRHIIRSATSDEHYNLIVLDIMMPKVSGADILEFMVHKNIDTPVLVITGFINYDIKFFCSRLSKVDILQKPFLSSVFISKINEMLAEPTNQRSNA